MNISRAPWNGDELANLRRRQRAEHLHPYTCPIHGRTALVAEKSGWRCPEQGCDYEQDWAHADDAAGEIPASPLFGNQLRSAMNTIRGERLVRSESPSDPEPLRLFGTKIHEAIETLRPTGRG